MKVRMKTLMVGPEGAFQPGQIVEVEPGRAAALIAGGYAEEVELTPPEAAIATSASAEAARVDVDDQAAPVEKAMPPEASADEAMGAGDEEQPPEKPSVRRGRSRKS